MGEARLARRRPASRRIRVRRSRGPVPHDVHRVMVLFSEKRESSRRSNPDRGGKMRLLRNHGLDGTGHRKREQQLMCPHCGEAGPAAEVAEGSAASFALLGEIDGHPAGSASSATRGSWSKARTQNRFPHCAGPRLRRVTRCNFGTTSSTDNTGHSGRGGRHGLIRRQPRDAPITASGPGSDRGQPPGSGRSAKHCLLSSGGSWAARGAASCPPSSPRRVAAAGGR